MSLEQLMCTEGIIYSRTNKGHKVSYGLSLRAIYGFRVRHGERNWALLRELMAASNLVFSTLDDDYVTFFLVAVARSLLGRPTAALFLRPQTCIMPRTAVQRVKCAGFRALRRFRMANVLVIVPFDVEPRYARFAADWVHDPEYWDLDLKLANGALPTTPLSDEMIALAAGRRLVALPGTLTARKGFALLVEMLETDPALADRALFVSAGRIDPGAVGLAQRFEGLGGVALDRFVSDDELFSLYRVADYMWAAYAPEYDQSSGVFGRALQTRSPVIVRAGSLIEDHARTEGLNCLALPFGDAHTALSLFDAAASHPRTESPSIDAAGNIVRRKRFITCTNRGLAVLDDVDG